MSKLFDNDGDGGNAIAEEIVKEFQLGENGPTTEEYDRLISFLDVKRQISYLDSLLFNVGVGWVLGVKQREYKNKSSLLINHGKLLDDLLYIHGNEILVDG
eukprot:CCRYP_015016-RA/>CCRYP_015016-RA protein AED:0.97 eAED:1.00 QI:0/0/0/0.33/0.5/0.33/3/0/100